MVCQIGIALKGYQRSVWHCPQEGPVLFFENLLQSASTTFSVDDCFAMYCMLLHITLLKSDGYYLNQPTELHLVHRVLEEGLATKFRNSWE